MAKNPLFDLCVKSGGNRYDHLLRSFFLGKHPYSKVEKVVGEWNLLTLSHHQRNIMGHLWFLADKFPIVFPGKTPSEVVKEISSAFFEWVEATPPKVVPEGRKFFRSSDSRSTSQKKEEGKKDLPKLTILIRGDLSFGRQLAQVAHAAQQWAVDHPSEFSEWFHDSNTLIVRSVPDEASLHSELDRMASVAAVSSFVEPGYRDMPNTLTAVAVGPEGYQAVAHLPLATG